MITCDFGIIIASLIAILGLVVLLALEMIESLDQYIEQQIKLIKMFPGNKNNKLKKFIDYNKN